LLLFDAAPGQLADGHAFGVLNVLGVADPSIYQLIYDDVATGDIFLAIPEPSAALVAGCALLALAARRRRQR
jgi:hypothetical protein